MGSISKTYGITNQSTTADECGCIQFNTEMKVATLSVLTNTVSIGNLSLYLLRAFHLRITTISSQSDLCFDRYPHSSLSDTIH